MKLRPHPGLCWAAARLHIRAGSSQSCLCNPEKLLREVFLGFLKPAEQHRAQGMGTQGFSQHTTATQTEQSSSSPHQGKPRDSLRLVCLSSGPKPACNGRKQRCSRPVRSWMELQTLLPWIIPQGRIAAPPNPRLWKERSRRQSSLPWAILASALDSRKYK